MKSDRRGYIKTRKDGTLLVGARSPADPEADYPGYDGPVAEVYADANWLNICTDSYEGHAMLNIEALPYLRRALAQIAKERRAKQKDQSE